MLSQGAWRSATAKFLSALLLAAFSLSNLSCSKSQGEPSAAARDDAVPVTTARVELVPMDRTLSVVGTLFAKDEAVLGAEVEGKVEKTRVDFGDRVTSGQELALIDTTSYEALARQSAANVAKAKATALNAEANLNRTQELQKNNIASASQFDEARATAEQARAEVQAAEASDGIAQLNLGRSHAKAPFDGAVAERIANAGDYVKVGAPLFHLVNDGVLKYIVQAPERYASQVQKEQLVQFTVDAWPGETFEGKVYLISPSVTTATRAFPFGALVQNPARRLKANTFARGQLILERNVSTPMVPIDAVINFAGVTKVFVVESDLAHAREVQVGRIKEGRQEILGGLKEGEWVVLTGQTKLQEGSKVRLQDPKSISAEPPAAQKPS
jgi:membrane fusion protein (multidrug efflux system)